jgi:hypothetical protein
MLFSKPQFEDAPRMIARTSWFYPRRDQWALLLHPGEKFQEDSPNFYLWRFRVMHIRQPDPMSTLTLRAPTFSMWK